MHHCRSVRAGAAGRGLADAARQVRRRDVVGAEGAAERLRDLQQAAGLHHRHRQQHEAPAPPAHRVVQVARHLQRALPRRPGMSHEQSALEQFRGSGLVGICIFIQFGDGMELLIST